MSKLEIGKYNNLPHYAVIGEPTDFYVWINTGESLHSYQAGKAGASGWIKGNEAFREYNKLRQLYKKDKTAFIDAIVQLHRGYAPKKG